MDDQTKCEVYEKLLYSLGENGELKEETSESTYSDQIKLIRDNFLSKVVSDQETALQVLQVLLYNKIHSIQSDAVNILNDASLEQSLKNKIIEIITHNIKELVQSSSVTELCSFYSILQSYDIPKFSTILKEISNDSECNQHCKLLLLNTIIPIILDTKNVNDPSKVTCIDMALEFASVIPISILNPEEYNTFSGNIAEYINNILTLRDGNFNHWHKLWMFLVRFLGKKLHHSMNLMNKLLRVVEHAFRNSSCEQRLRSYDCWKEIIDNANLEPHHISSEKQIRLLLTPLRAKFSRQEAVIVKRFEVFVYLIEKLEDKAVLVLKEFLEFCFGEVGENTDPHKAGQGKSLPELWIRSAKVLLTALGHSHDKNEICLDTKDDGHIPLAVLNTNNISTLYYHVINSVAECCKLLKEVELDQQRNTIIKCYWRSLFKIIIDDELPQRDKCIACIGKALHQLLKDNDPYCLSIASIIFKETVKIEKPAVFHLVWHNLDHFLHILFSVPLSKGSYIDVQKFLAILESSPSDVSGKMVSQVFNSFINFKTLETNADFVADVWIFLVNKLEDYAMGNSLDFLVWPVLHVHQLTEHVKEVSIYEHYQRQLIPFIEKSDELHLSLFKYFEKALKNNPLLLKNVFNVITLFNVKMSHKDIANTTLNILTFMLLLPTTSDSTNQRESVELYVKKLYQTNIGNIHDQDTIKRLCVCGEHLLKLKHYDILSHLEESLIKLPDNVKRIYGKFISLDFLVDIFDKESDLKVTESIHRIMERIRSIKDAEPKKDISPFMPLGGRSAKIATLVKQIPASPNKALSPLRLFGKDVETHSALKVAGSLLKTESNTLKKDQVSTPPQKKKSTTFIDDESNSKFVLIETEVKIDKGKLTEHQKEALKKRREDIPALYQDLSQSVSQTFDSDSFNASKSNEPDCFKKPAELEVKHFNIQLLTKGETHSKETDETETSETADSSKAKGKKGKGNELKNLSMNIVGAENFVATGSKRTRKEKKVDESDEKSRPKRKTKKQTVDPKADKDNGTGESSNKRFFKDINVSDNNVSEGNEDLAEKLSHADKELEDTEIITSEQLYKELKKIMEPTVQLTSLSKNTINTVIGVTELNSFPETKTVAENHVEDMPLSSKAEKPNEEQISESALSALSEDHNKITVPADKSHPTKIPLIINQNSATEGKPPVKTKNYRKPFIFGDGSKEVRKSRRKSLPTQKIAQSELFKAVKMKCLPFGNSNKTTKLSDDLQKNNVFDEKSTQSELFKTEPENVNDLEIESIANGPKDSQKESNLMDYDEKVKNELEKAVQDEEKIGKLATEQHKIKQKDRKGKSNKRKRLSSTEDEDIIESSQESSVSNVTAAKLRLSVGRKYNVTPVQNKDLPIHAEGRPKKTPKRTLKTNSHASDSVESKISVFSSATKKKMTDNIKTDSEIVQTKATTRRRKKTNSNDETPKTGSPATKRTSRGRPKKTAASRKESNSKHLKQDSSGNNDNKKRKRRKKNLQVSDEPDLEKTVDTSWELTFEANTPESPSKIGRRKSPRKHDKEDTVKDLLDHVKKQIFSEKVLSISEMKKQDKQSKKQATKRKEADESNQCIENSPETQDIQTENKVFKEKMAEAEVHTVESDKQIFTQNATESHVVELNTQPKEDEKPIVLTKDIKEHSEDTQTQGTESLEIGNSENQLQLDLPQKVLLTESEQEIARMDTISLPLVGDVDISCNNKTLIENGVLTEAIAVSEDVVASIEEVACEQTIKPEANLESETVTESEDIISSLPENKVPVEITKTEELVRQLTDRDIEVTVELDHFSPIAKRMPEECVGKSKFIDTPGSFKVSLPSSPITGDTPNRNSELLSNTSDISPIGSNSGADRSSSDDEFVEERKLVPVALKFDDEDTEQHAHEQKSPEKGDDAPQKIDETSPEKAEKEVEIIALGSPSKSDAKISKDVSSTPVEKANSRFSWVKQGSPATHRFFSRRKTAHNMSPSASRIKKLMSNVKPSSQGELADEISQEDILTFTREVPSPLAVPRSSILKRKHSDAHEDGMSPCAKRKRVNFSDPCTTSKKVFLKDDTAPSQCLFNVVSNDDLDKQFLEVLAANSIETPQTESDNIETEPSLQINNPMLLRDDVPIYPELIDCEENLSVISRKLTGPMFVNALLSKMNSKNIKTIGDLAKQSEAEIARLPFKTPMVQNVYKTLDNYFHKNFKSKGSAEKVEFLPVNGEQEQEVAIAFPAEEVIVESVDVKEELSSVLERACDQNIPTETLCALVLETVDLKQVLTWIRTHSNFDPKDFVEEKDFSRILKHITDTLGLPKIFDILRESFDSPEDESVYFDCIMKDSIDKRPLSDLIEKRSLQELQVAIWGSVENEKYSKKDLLDTCFLPYVYSIDLAPFFNKLTVVEVSDIVLNRLQTEDYKSFIKRITERCTNREEVRDEVLENYAISELTNNILKRSTSKEILSSFTDIFLTAAKEDKEDLTRMFRLVSDGLVERLAPCKLMELSVEFLKKIPLRD